MDHYKNYVKFPLYYYHLELTCLVFFIKEKLDLFQKPSDHLIEIRPNIRQQLVQPVNLHNYTILNINKMYEQHNVKCNLSNLNRKRKGIGA